MIVAFPMAMRILLRVLIAVAALAAPASAHTARAQAVTVLAAASMSDALSGIGDAFTRETGTAVRFSFAASSALARQIAAGAPADIFVSANAEWMDDLETRGLLAAGTRGILAGNRLVLVVADGDRASHSEVSTPPDFDRLLGERGRLAVGDPDHVPAGIYARQALMAWGLWDAVQGRLARADNVRAALALVERGEAPAGIVYATDAEAAGKVSIAGVLPDALHEPIVYPFAIVAGHDSEDARAFVRYLTGPVAKSILAAHGFAVE